MIARTLFDKIWDAHVVQTLPDGWALLHIDRHLLHDLSGTISLKNLTARGLPVLHPETAFASPDHAISTTPWRTGETFSGGAELYRDLRNHSRQLGIRLFDVGRPGHGIVHVIGPELGIVQPGFTVVSGDSHTCTSGALGAIAFGVGASELSHSLATQTLILRKPKTMRIRFRGTRAAGVTAKDLALYMVRLVGVSGAAGFAVEYDGAAIEALEMEERMTLCNLSVEMGARIGLIAPDLKTVAYLREREFSPKGERMEQALSQWQTLYSDSQARFDREICIDVGRIPPTITWGTSPAQSMAVTDCVPEPAACTDPSQRREWQAALDYMGLAAGSPILGTRVDRVFIGSCANARLSDLQQAAALIRGHRVASHVNAWVVPGSEYIKRQAEDEGLDVAFREAGFHWREPGCGMCVAANGEHAAPGQRVVSTSSRNFVGRQGPGVRTHLASPIMAVASAVRGEIADARAL